MGLWNQINTLKAKVKNDDGRRERGTLKDTGKDRFRQSRHEIFYNAKHYGNEQLVRKLPAISSPRKLSNLPPVKKLHSKMTWKSDLTKGGKGASPAHSRSRSNSNSTSSYSSFVGSTGSRVSNEKVNNKKNRVVQCKKDFCRSRSSSSYNTIKLSNNLPHESRSISLSPGRRFDPTAYITEKKKKQSRIANIRMQNIESHIIRSGSADSKAQIQRSPSIGRNSRPSTPLTRTTVSPTALHRVLGSVSRENAPAKYLKTKKKMSANDIFSTKTNSGNKKPLKDCFERKVMLDTSRPVSADSYRTKILSASPQFSFGDNTSLKMAKIDRPEVGRKSSQMKSPKNNMRSGNSPYISNITSDLKDRILRTPTKRTNRSKPKPSMNSKAVNTSFTCDQLDSLVSLDKNLIRSNQSDKRANDKKDIISLQEKLSSLHAFLETCK